MSACLVIEDDGVTSVGNVELALPEVQFPDGIDAVIIVNRYPALISQRADTSEGCLFLGLRIISPANPALSLSRTSRHSVLPVSSKDRSTAVLARLLVVHHD
jgi:hypothetical protein